MRTVFSMIVAALAALSGPSIAVDDPPPGTIRHEASRLAWKAAPAPFPAGLETVVLEGDPRSGEIFTLRLRAPAGARLAPHTHPLPERVTVLQGAIAVGFGPVFDAARLRVFRAGDYYVNPPGEPHFVSFVEDSVVQVTGHGPWGVDWVSP
jgi:quercetin dioxygenase-like cupin family protein